MPNAIDRLVDAETRLFRLLGLDVERGTVALDGSDMELRVLRTGDGPPMVLVASEGQPASSWAPLLAGVHDARAIACELPGFGGSSGLTYRHLDLRSLAVHVVGGVLDGHGLDDAVLVGSSSGGAFALYAAAAMPERVRAVAVFGCPGPAAPGSHLPAALVPVGVRGVDRMLLDLPLPPFGVQKAAFRRVYGRDAVDGVPESLLQAMHHAMDRPSFAPAMASFAETAYGLRRADRSLVLTDDEAAAITMPTLLVWGQRDRFGGAGVARRLAGMLPAARLELLPTGHAPWWEQPERCAELLRELLDDPAVRTTGPRPDEDRESDDGSR